MSQTDTLIAPIQGLTHRPDAPAILAMTATGVRTVSRGELFEWLVGLAAGLAARLAPGETVAVYAADSPEWITDALAAMRAGMVVLPLDVQTSAEYLAHMLPVPVVPVHIQGTFEAMPLGRHWPRLEPVRVSFGPALDPRPLIEVAGEAGAARITAAIAARLAAMGQEARTRSDRGACASRGDA